MKDGRRKDAKTRNQENQIPNATLKDSSAKLIFDDHVLCAQFLRDYVDVGLLKDVRPEDIEDISERFLWLWQENRESDSVKKIHLRDCEGMDTLFLITVIEHQSKVDYDMSFRLLRYIVQILTDYAKEAEGEREGITRQKEFHYPPILPIVFFDGPGQWTAKKDFRDRVYLKEVLGEFIPSFQYIVVPLSQYTNEELIEKRDELSLIMLVDKLRSASDFRELRKLPEGYLEEITRASPETVLELIGKIIAALLIRLNVPREEVEEFTDRIERREFAMLFENFEAYDVQETRRISRAEGKAEGKREGRAEGKAEGKAEGILELLEEIGPVSDELRERIMSETDLELLRRWLKQAAKADSVETFVAEM